MSVAGLGTGAEVFEWNFRCVWSFIGIVLVYHSDTKSLWIDRSDPHCFSK